MAGPMPQPPNPEECQHSFDFDKILFQRRSRQRHRICAECEKCGVVASLDQVLTNLMARVRLLEAAMEPLDESEEPEEG